MNIKRHFFVPLYGSLRFELGFFRIEVKDTGRRWFNEENCHQGIWFRSGQMFALWLILNFVSRSFELSVFVEWLQVAEPFFGRKRISDEGSENPFIHEIACWHCLSFNLETIDAECTYTYVVKSSSSFIRRTFVTRLTSHCLILRDILIQYTRKPTGYPNSLRQNQNVPSRNWLCVYLVNRIITWIRNLPLFPRFMSGCSFWIILERMNFRSTVEILAT